MRVWFTFLTADGRKFYTPATSYKKNIFSPLGSKDSLTLDQVCESLNSKDVTLHQYPQGIVKKHEINVTEDLVELPSGNYTCARVASSLGLVARETRKDPHIVCREEREITEDIRLFLNTKKIYDELGVLYKRGYLLYGPPGNGKTSLIRRICARLPSAIIMETPWLPTDGMRSTLANDPRLKVLIIEEVTYMANENIDALLRFMDGETSMPNMIVFATTNYPNKLPGNIKDRPSRFDMVIEVANPEGENLTEIAQLYLGRAPEKLDLTSLAGCSSAMVKEICLQSRLRNKPVPDVRHIIDSRRKGMKDTFATENDPGNPYNDMLELDEA